MTDERPAGAPAKRLREAHKQAGIAADQLNDDPEACGYAVKVMEDAELALKYLDAEDLLGDLEGDA